MTAKAKTYISDNRVEEDKDPVLPVYHTQRMANYERLYSWVKSAMIDLKGDLNINVNEADYIATYINNQLPSDVELAPTLSPRSLMEFHPEEKPPVDSKEKIKAVVFLLFALILVCLFWWLLS